MTQLTTLYGNVVDESSIAAVEVGDYVTIAILFNHGVTARGDQGTSVHSSFIVA